MYTENQKKVLRELSDLNNWSPGITIIAEKTNMSVSSVHQAINSINKSSKVKVTPTKAKKIIQAIEE